MVDRQLHACVAAGMTHTDRHISPCHQHTTVNWLQRSVMVTMTAVSVSVSRAQRADTRQVSGLLILDTYIPLVANTGSAPAHAPISVGDQPFHPFHPSTETAAG
jgi:hypothetical protein